MNQPTDPDTAVPPDEAIPDFGALYPRQVAYGQYRVLSIKNDGTENTHYLVNIKEGTCDCKDAEFQTESDHVCKHLAAALYAAPKRHSVEEMAVADLSETVRRVEAMVDGSALSSDASASVAIDDATDDADADVDHEGDVRILGDGLEEEIGTLQGWFGEAADFANFDRNIIDLSAAKAEGRSGVAVERQPFRGGYYDDDEWQDKETYDTYRENVGDLLASRDEFQWYGEPDYVYFVAKEDVEEVVG